MAQQSERLAAVFEPIIGDLGSVQDQNLEALEGFQPCQPAVRDA